MSTNTQQVDDTKTSTTAKKDKPKAKPRPKSRKGVSKPNQRKGRGPSRTFPFTAETVTLHHGVAQGLYDRFYNRFRSAFYHTMSVMQRHGLENGIDQVHKYLDEMITDSMVDLERGKARLLERLKAKVGSTAYSATSPSPETRKAEIPSFIVRRYLELIQACDDLCDVIVYAENVGAITWNDRRQLMLNAKKYVSKPGGRFGSLAQRISNNEFKRHASAEAALDSILGDMNALEPIRKGRSLKADGKSNGTVPVKKKTAAKKKTATKKKTTKKTAKKKAVVEKPPSTNVPSKPNGAAESDDPWALQT